MDRGFFVFRWVKKKVLSHNFGDFFPVLRDEKFIVFDQENVGWFILEINRKFVPLKSFHLTMRATKIN